MRVARRRELFLGGCPTVKDWRGLWISLAEGRTVKKTLTVALAVALLYTGGEG